ncbi:MAG: hypothetical protein BIFFINMI_01644 [Phycisphaerae bacterium]|nr:hypothetical protein [Phycisphaerae bacterium]
MLMGGCAGGPGWTRLEGPSMAPQDVVVLQDVESASPGRPSERAPVRSVVFSGRGMTTDANGEPIRAWQMIALASPSDAPGRVDVWAVVGVANHLTRTTTHWKLYRNQQQMEFWTYHGRWNIYGQVSAHGPVEEDLQPQLRFSASLDPSIDPDDYLDGVDELHKRLLLMRADLEKRSQEGQSAADELQPRLDAISDLISRVERIEKN